VSLVIEGAGGCAAVGACHLGFSSSIELTEAPRLKPYGLMAVTPEVASSSLVGPAISLSVNYLHSSDRDSTSGGMAGGFASDVSR
jgi:hypothetical protein